MVVLLTVRPYPNRQDASWVTVNGHSTLTTDIIPYQKYYFLTDISSPILRNSIISVRKVNIFYGNYFFKK